MLCLYLALKYVLSICNMYINQQVPKYFMHDNQILNISGKKYEVIQIV